MSSRPLINQVSMLELTMRGSMEGMQELAAEFAYCSGPGVFEIISIEAAEDASILTKDGFKTG